MKHVARKLESTGWVAKGGLGVVVLWYSAYTCSVPPRVSPPWPKNAYESDVIVDVDGD